MDGLVSEGNNAKPIPGQEEPTKPDQLPPEEKEKYLEIGKLVIEYLGEITGNQEIHEEDSLEEIGINSIQFVKLVVALEERFNINFEDEELNYTLYPNLLSIIALVYEKVNSASDMQ